MLSSDLRKVTQSVLHKLILTLAITAAGLTAAAAEPAMVPETDPVLVGTPPFRRLFLDPMVAEESHGLERVFHAAQKYKVNPVLVEEQSWEGNGPKLGAPVMRVDGKLRMYYYTQPFKRQGGTGIVESTDGIHWTRPRLGVVERNGSKENNLVNALVRQAFKLKDPASPERAWVAYESYSGGTVAWSPDGLNWTYDKELQGKLFSAGDVVNWFYDPYRQRMAATWKTVSRQHRACGIVFSKDGLKWQKPIDGPVFGSDGLDPDGTQVYGMPVFAYQGIYIGLPWIYHARWIKYGKYTDAEVMFEAQKGSPRTIDIQLAWSWDLINWTRTSTREPFIPNGPKGSFDYGMVLHAKMPLVMGDELWFYYTGYELIHDVPGGQTAIGLAKLRLDGFCSMHAGWREGWLISRREIFNTPKVTVNAKCAAGGYVTAELVDRNNKVIPGFEKDKCIPFSGDSVRGELTWKTAAFRPDWLDKDKKIRFYLKNADVYSYLPADINQKIDDGWPDN